MSPNDADGMENSVDPDQTLGADWSGSALFVQTYLSENLGSQKPNKRFQSLTSSQSNIPGRICGAFSVLRPYFDVLNFKTFASSGQFWFMFSYNQNGIGSPVNSRIGE